MRNIIIIINPSFPTAINRLIAFILLNQSTNPNRNAWVCYQYFWNCIKVVISYLTLLLLTFEHVRRSTRSVFGTRGVGSGWAITPCRGDRSAAAIWTGQCQDL